MLIRQESEETRYAVVVGDLMTDLVVRLKEDFAEESDTAAQITTGPGGSASNVAVFLARGDIATALVGTVGDDEHGRSLVAALVGAGVAPRVRVEDGALTGTVVSIVFADGRRSMLTDRGANLSLDVESVPEELFGARGHLHLSGYEVIEEATRPAAKAIFDRAGGAGMSRSVDCSSAAPLRRMGPEAFFDATKGADVLFANGDEAHALTGSSDPAVFAEALAARYPKSIVTLGSTGACLVQRGVPAVLVPPRDAVVVDTTGAGDAFTGAFLAAWLHGAEPSSAIETGLVAAATIVEIPGARPW